MSRNMRASSGMVRFTREKDEKLANLPDSFSEAVDDRINTLLVEGDNITLTYNDAANSLTIAAAGGGPGGISDGDKGDIVISSSASVWTVDSGAITLGKMANLAANSIIGNNTGSAATPIALTPAQVRTLLNVADGATANATNAELRDRSTHTGTQAAATITGLATVATSGAYSDLSGIPSGGTNYFGSNLIVPAAGLFISNGLNNTALGTAAQVANRTVITPFIPGHAVSIDQLGCSVSTLLASSNVKLVIYDSDSNGRPTTILRETANIDSGSTGTKFSAISSLALTAGKVYWVGLRSSGTQTVRTLGVGATPVISYTNAATPVGQGTLILTETFGNAAANWTYASNQHSNVAAPLILMRVA